MGLFRGSCLQKSVFFIILFFIITLACLSLTLLTAGINDESKRSSLHLLNSLHIDSLSKNAQVRNLSFPSYPWEKHTVLGGHLSCVMMTAILHFKGQYHVWWLTCFTCCQANDTNESEVEAVLELKTEPPTTLGPYDAEYEMRKNADYTREVCQSLTE